MVGYVQINVNADQLYLRNIALHPDVQGQGIGTRLWFHRRDALLARLDPGASIGMDGVFDMQDWYAKGFDPIVKEKSDVFIEQELSDYVMSDIC